MAKVVIPEMTDEIIIKKWKTGYTVQQISKDYAMNKKLRGTKITLLEAQRYVEPIIFKYQTDLMRS